jgi:hypothetical protein
MAATAPAWRCAPPRAVWCSGARLRSTTSRSADARAGRARLAHHSRELRFTPYGVIRGEPREPAAAPSDPDDLDAWFEPAYGWLADRLGSWPIFLAVGAGRYSRAYQTGYANQWLVKAVGHRDRAERRYRRAGEFPSRVLLSWAAVPAGALFLDPGHWTLVLNRVEKAPDGTRRMGRVSAAEERLVLKPGWDAERWLRRARREGGSVEAVVGELDLRSADEIWCRNRAARSELVARGFDPERVRAVRVPVEPWP